ncbi:hypothetical protein NDU88_005383 [Pleurodeles waltl]|uniref:Uncharacterized protein n=1 Tax=Pleurodeles waltl TaxID=8319 RepID=A0AAV7TCG4_PLEWA|nr:hypothetical protein NDU88_005383 [Pleurodeles waltl]
MACASLVHSGKKYKQKSVSGQRAHSLPDCVESEVACQGEGSASVVEHPIRMGHKLPRTRECPGGSVGCGNAPRRHGSGSLVKLKTAMERRSHLATPVKVRVPSGHPAEERVVSLVNDPTSREWPGETAVSVHMYSSEMPMTSRSADLRNSGLAIHDEILDYEDDREMEEGEIWEDGEQTVDKRRQQRGGKNVNKERSFGVLQELTSRTVHGDRTGKKDS